MVTPRNPTTWYWIVGDTNPTTKVWNSTTAAYDDNTNATYQAWVGATSDGTITNTPPRVNVTGAANNGAGLIRLTVDSTSTFATGNVRVVQNVGGTTEANGTWTLTVIDSTHVDLQTSTFTHVYTSGGVLGGGTVIDTQTNLQGVIASYNAVQWATVPQANTISSAADITLSADQTNANHLAKFINITNTAGAAINVILPDPLLLGSPPPGAFIRFYNNSTLAADTLNFWDTSISGPNTLVSCGASGTVDATLKNYTGTGNTRYLCLNTVFAAITADFQFDNNIALEVVGLNGEKALTTYTATLTPNAGSITNGGSSSGQRFGKFVVLNLAPTVAAISGGPANVTLTLPVAPLRSGVLFGRENVNTGDRLSVAMTAGTTTTGGIRDLITNALRAPALNDLYAFDQVYESQ